MKTMKESTVARKCKEGWMEEVWRVSETVWEVRWCRTGKTEMVNVVRGK